VRLAQTSAALLSSEGSWLTSVKVECLVHGLYPEYREPLLSTEWEEPLDNPFQRSPLPLKLASPDYVIQCVVVVMGGGESVAVKPEVFLTSVCGTKLIHQTTLKKMFLLPSPGFAQVPIIARPLKLRYISDSC